MEKIHKISSLDRNHKLDLSEIVKLKPEKIDVARKYRGKINKKLEVFK
jgi:hypothetical protein